MAVPHDPVTVGAGPLAAPVAEAVTSTATAYAEEPAVDVEDRLRRELAMRGTALEDASVAALARAVRAGRSEELVTDGSLAPDDT